MYFLADELKYHNDEAQLLDGRWVLARPINFRYESWRERLRDAWAVLTGKVDTLYWIQQ